MGNTSQLTQYLAPLLKYKKLIGIATGVCLLAGLAYAMVTPKNYVSTVSILVTPISDDPIESVGSGDVKVDMQTELKIATSPPVVTEVEDRLAAQAIQVNRSVLESNVIANGDDSRLLDISFTAPTPELAQTIAAAYGDAYLSYRITFASDVVANQTRTIDQEIQAIQNELAQIEAELRSTSENSEQFFQLRQDQQTAETQLNKLEQQLAEVSTLSVEAGKVISAANLPASPTGIGLVPIVVGATLAGFTLSTLGAYLYYAFKHKPEATNFGRRREDRVTTNRRAGDRSDDSAAGDAAGNIDDEERRGASGSTAGSASEQLDAIASMQATRPTASNDHDPEPQHPTPNQQANQALTQAASTVARPSTSPQSSSAQPNGAPANTTPAHGDSDAHGDSGSGTPIWSGQHTQGIDYSQGALYQGSEYQSSGESFTSPADYLSAQQAEQSSRAAQHHSEHQNLQAGPFAQHRNAAASVNAATPQPSSSNEQDRYDPHNAVPRQLQSNLQGHQQPHVEPAQGNPQINHQITPQNHQNAAFEQTSYQQPPFNQPPSHNPPGSMTPGAVPQNARSQNPISQSPASQTDTQNQADYSLDRFAQQHSGHEFGSQGAFGSADTERFNTGPPDVGSSDMGPSDMGLSNQGTTAERRDDTGAIELVPKPKPRPRISAAKEAQARSGQGPARRALDESTNIVQGNFYELLRKLQRLGHERAVTVAVLGEATQRSAISTGFDLGDELQELGARVLLVDMMFTEPMLQNLLGIELTPGLAEILRSLQGSSRTGAVTLQHGARGIGNSAKFRALPAGQLDRTTKVAIDGAPFAHFLADARTDFHVIVLVCGKLTDVGHYNNVLSLTDGVIIASPAPEGASVPDAMTGMLSMLPTPTLQVIAEDRHASRSASLSHQRPAN